MAQLQPPAKQQYFDNAGLPLVGGKIYTYLGGTNTPKATFSDAAGLAPNTNPIILDARGEALVFWDGVYKITLTDALDNPIYTVDNVQQANPAYRTSATGSLITPAGTTAQRDIAPEVGFLRWNTSLSSLEVFNGSTWTNNFISLGASSGPDGSPLGYRNKVTGGDCRIAVIGNKTYTGGAAVYGGCDNILVSATNVTTGTIAQVVGGGSAGIFGVAQGLTALTTSAAGEVLFETRIEAADVITLAGKAATITLSMFQDTGVPLTMYIRVAKATAVDNFAAKTTLYTSSSSALPTSSKTKNTYVVPTLTLADVQNGLSVTAVITTTAAVVNRNFTVTDLQLEEGSVATPMETRPIGVERQLCARLLPNYSASAVGGLQVLSSCFAINPNNNFCNVPMSPPARVPPTGLVISSLAHFTVTSSGVSSIALTSLVFQNASYSAVRLNAVVAAGVAAGEPGEFTTASAAARMYFTGCQL